MENTAGDDYIRHGRRADAGGKLLVLFNHFHGTGGTSVCDFAKRASKRAESGVKLHAAQWDEFAMCNLDGWSPIDAYQGRRPDPLLGTCDGLLQYARDRALTWAHVETALDLKPPCRGVAFVTVLREPWRRMLTEITCPMHVREALDLFKRIRAGDTVRNSSHLVGHMSLFAEGEPVFRALYFDNYYVRALLGTAEGRQLPWGAVREEHFRRARATLEAFDLVMLTESLSGAFAMLQEAVGSNFDLDVSTGNCSGANFGWGRRSNARRTPPLVDWPGLLRSERRELVANLAELERRFRARNRYDLKLYAWAAARWRAASTERGAGRDLCRASASGSDGRGPRRSRSGGRAGSASRAEKFRQVWRDRRSRQAAGSLCVSSAYGQARSEARA